MEGGRDAGRGREREIRREGEGMGEMVSRKAAGSISGFLKLCKICVCLKGGEKKRSAGDSPDDRQEREGMRSGSRWVCSEYQAYPGQEGTILPSGL